MKPPALAISAEVLPGVLVSRSSYLKDGSLAIVRSWAEVAVESAPDGLALSVERESI